MLKQLHRRAAALAACRATICVGGLAWLLNRAFRAAVKGSVPSTERKIALCYVRKSFTKNKKDVLSPERQRKYIESTLKEHPDWEPLWFEDVEGHRSGRTEQGRPDFLKMLDEILLNPYIVAIIVTEYSRLTRSVFTSAKMIELLKVRGIRLIFAYSATEADVQTPAGRIQLNIEAAASEFYADFVGMMQGIRIAALRAEGKWVGETPQGTRLRKGNLSWRTTGAWFLPDGSFQTGTPDVPPAPGAIFRSYKETVEQIMYLYLAKAEGTGATQIAQLLNSDGYPFRTSQGHPRPYTADDVRRVLADWPAYGGIYLAGKAKDRAGYQEPDADTLTFLPKKALLPPVLLKEIARMRKARGIARTAGDGIVADSIPHPLAQLTRCAICEKRARALRDTHYQTRLGGHYQGNTARYRHRNDVVCSVHKRSILAAELEERFETELARLQPQPERFAALVQHAIECSRRPELQGTMDADPEVVRQHQVERLREKVRRLEKSYLNVTITEADYEREKQSLLTQLAEWEGQVVDTKPLTLALTDYLIALENPLALWRRLDEQGRRNLAHHLFDYLLYDLDQDRFTEVHPAAWTTALFTVTAAP